MEVPGFRMVSKLGTGAMGTVYLAVQEDLDRQVALKLLGTDSDERPSVRRFHREAQVMATLRHPAIVRLYAYQDDPKRPYLVMEYLSGGTLKERLQDHPGGLEIAAVTQMAHDLLGALAELHDAAVSHRDVKPANILYRATGEAVLGDLGLVSATSLLDTRLTRPQVALGTIAYMAPEALATGEMGPLGDLYATGVTLFEALTGTHPTGFRAAVPGARLRDPGTLRVDAPRPLCDAILALAEPDPSLRIESAAAALKILSRPLPSRPARAAKGGSAGRMPVVERSTPTRRKSPAPLAAACAAGLILGAACYLFTREAPPPSIELRAGARSLTVIARPAVPERLLCVYDAGAPVSSAQGTGSDASTTFQVAGLRPGQDYRAQLLATGATMHAPVDVTFRTSAEVELLGVDNAGPQCGVWMRATPQTLVRWAGERDWVAVSGEPTRVAGRPRDLEVQVGTSVPAVIAVTAAHLPADAPLDLGLSVGGDPLHEQVQEHGQAPRPLMDWLIETRIPWVALSPAEDGRPRLAQDLRAYPRAPRRILSMRVPTAAVRDAWLKEIERAAPPDAPLHLAVDADWMYSAGLSAQGDEELGTELRAWRAWLDRNRPDWKLLVPAPMGLVFMQASTTLSHWLRALGRLEALSLESLSDGATFEADRAKLHRALDKFKLRSELRFIWIVATIRTEYMDTAGVAPGGRNTDSLGLARCFLFARAAYPDVTLIADFNEAAGLGPLRRLTTTWERLAGVARALRGTRFRKYLGGTGRDAPRVESRVRVLGLAFAGPAHGVQVLCTESRPTRARFTPARPGILNVPGTSQAPWSSRIVPTTAPLDLELNSAPTIYEELVPVQATARGTAALEVITR